MKCKRRAWRIDEHVERGEIDCREKGCVTGRIWLAGRAEPLTLDLAGNPWCDVAGHIFRFVNPGPVQTFADDGLAPRQAGVVGDITASCKVRAPSCSDEELMAHIRARTEFPWRWGNALFLEWFSKTNGRVVIESAKYRITVDPGGTWEMTEEEEAEQRRANGEAMVDFFERLVAGRLDEERKTSRRAPRRPTPRRRG